jgi:hypothetical protein
LLDQQRLQVEEELVVDLAEIPVALVVALAVVFLVLVDRLVVVLMRADCQK